MPLTLVTGPAGSGKTGEVLDRFAAALEQEPVLVVPTLADVERFEDELLARRPVALGGRVVTFDRLFDLVGSATGVTVAPRPTPAQRLALVGAAIRALPLRALAEPARRPGFPDALEDFIAEAQAALIGPGELAQRIEGDGRDGASSRPGIRELAALYAAYCERRDRLGRADADVLARGAITALRAKPAAWSGRPVFIHGFDDLAPGQLALVEALAAAGDVLVSVVHESGRACLAARARLVERLERLGIAARVELQPRVRTGALAHLERAFLADAPDRQAPGDELRLLEAAGARAEVEQVGAAVAELLRSGVEPDQIAVVTRSTDDSAALLSEVFGRLEIPAAIHARRPLSETPTGRALLALVRAALTSRAAPDLVSFLRCPGRAPARQVDMLERSVRLDGASSVEEALERWNAVGGRRLWELDALRETGAGPGLLERIAGIAHDIAEWPRRRRAPEPSEAGRTDLAAGEAISRSLAEVAELATADPDLVPDAVEVVRLLEGLRLPWSRGSVAGRVEVMSPYRARARQFPYVFVLSLQEGDFPRRRREDPFLTDGERAAAGLPLPADQRDEERYLFYVAVTRATRRLHLSYRLADDEGRAATRSFFVDEVLDVLAPGAEAGITRSRGLSDTVFDASEAPTRRELARALAERRLLEPPPALGASPSLAGALRPALEVARERADRLPGSLRVPFVVEQFAAKRRIGASSLERHAECSFRYFVDHELRPRELAPTAQPLERGGITHRVLERLYAEYRGRRLTVDDLDTAIERAGELLAEEASGTGLDPRRPASRPLYRRMESDIARYLRHDAGQDDGTVLEVEASFGEREDDERPPLSLTGFELHGKIDRIDLVAPGRALIRDYKTGSTVSTRKQIREDKRLQLPLYMLALRELWGLEPVGGLYHPLGKQHGAVARGLVRGPREESPLAERLVSNDITADGEEFERALDGARLEAERLAGRIHAGELARDPLRGSCPEHCDFHPICRRERGDKNPEADNGERPPSGDD